MKKKFLGIAAVTAALTLSTGITAFAGWVKDGESWMWQNANGSFVYANWVTDPETGNQYFMDPDGHMMTGTHIQGFWLDDNGVKHEKTEAELEAEANRAARLASRPSPGKTTNEVNNAGNAAKTSNDAVSTTRRAYQAEVKAISDNFFVEIKNKLAKDNNTSYKGSVTNDNIEHTFSYKTSNGPVILSSSMPKNSIKTSSSYVPYALELQYNRAVVNDSSNVYFADAFQEIVKGVLGDNVGQTVYDQIAATEIGTNAAYKLSGLTDTGNSYELVYRYDGVNIKVTCSEIVPNNDEEQANTDNAEDAAASTASTESTTTASVITAGTGYSAASAAETEAAEEAAETEASEVEEDAE